MPRASITFGLCALLSGSLPASDFDSRVSQLLSANCAECHNPKTRTSGFSVDSMKALAAGGAKYGPAVLPGNPAASPLVRILKGELSPRMPFGKQLPELEIVRIEEWIRGLKPSEATQAAAAPWLWPFQKPRKSDPPAVKQSAWIANPIDAFILKKLEDRDLAPAPPASRRALARRLYFDLLGMPPTPGEMRSFLEDSSPDAYSRLVDRLLEDPRYGERWARHWLDLARYGETSGLEGDGAIGNAWRYRDWVIDAFQSDMPYDKFVIAQLAGGDEHSRTRNNYAPDIQGHIPVAFLRLAPWDRSNLVADEVRQNYLSEVTSSTASIFLGLTVGCARCHDHKYDPIPTRDFYRLQAFFNAIKVEDVDVPYKDKAQADRIAAKIKEYEQQLQSGPDARALKEMEAALLPRLIEKRTEQARGRKLTVADLRLELRRKDQSRYTPAEKQKQQRLLEDANRTQDLEERNALDAFEEQLLARLEPDDARYEELNAEDLRAELAKPSGGIFTSAEQERYRLLEGRKALLQRRIGRL
ncbi:MAG TPA: DUF1549 domain-containing protein, partial [Bryobacteraceae bacterium]|nr:DUF1549 domain-containing protein [Bryobacteraceae bacterium]